MEQKDEKLLYARLCDLSERAERGELAKTDFLNPAECRICEDFLRARGAHYIIFGGYEGAERKRIYILPDYMESVTDVQSFCDFSHETGIVVLCATPSGYRNLSHRDYLGSLVGLGIERAVIGDIVVREDCSAIIFCDETIACFLLSELCRVANDKISLREVTSCELDIPPRESVPITNTVASRRLDCVVSSVCSLSRERAKQIILSGLVEVDFLVEERPDRDIFAGAMLSIRGYGRYRVLSFGGQTRKGRYRLNAEQYI